MSERPAGDFGIGITSEPGAPRVDPPPPSSSPPPTGARGSGGGDAMAELTALESLIEMGFPTGRAEKALALTGNQGIEAAMDW